MASSEMKERILKQLRIFAELKEDEHDPMLDLIIKELKEDFDEEDIKINQKELCKRAAAVRQNILHNYTDFAVSTIDSFHNRVVQAFAQDLGLPYAYNLEESAEELVIEVIQQLQSQIQRNQDPSLSKLFRQIVFKSIEDDKNLFFDNDLNSFLNILQKENVRPYIEKAKEYTLENWINIERYLWKFIKTHERQISKLGEEALELIHNEGLQQSHFYNRGGVYTFFMTALKDVAKFLESDFKIAYKSYNEGKWKATGKGKLTALEEASIESIQPQLEVIFQKLDSSKNDSNTSDYIIANEMRQRILFIGLLRTVKLELELLKYERGIAFFSDLTFKINEIIENEPIPYVYERIGEKYNHILIDEFQDTSKMQWHNLLPLVTNSLAKQHFSMVVGDTKQSIYRWRGGQAEMLANLPKVPTLSPEAPTLHETSLLDEFHKVENLVINRRSQKGIIQFNNKLFNYIKDSYETEYPLISQFYNEVTQEFSKKDSSLISIELLEKHKNLYDETIIKRIIDKIDNAIQEGFEFKDIAILIRKNKYAPLIAQKLLRQGISVVSNESLLLVHSESVRFLIGFMKLLVIPLPPNAKMEIIKFLYEYKSDHLFEKPNNAGLDGKEFLEISQKTHDPDPMVSINHITTNFDFTIDVEKWAFLPLYDLAEKIASSFHLWENESEIIYLQKAFDYIKKYTLSGGNQIKSFLEKWDKKKEKLALQIPESENAVKIISIHKSKGLEYPVVILPYADWSLKIDTNKSDLLWHEWNQEIIDIDFVAFKPKKEFLNTQLSEVYNQEQEAVFIDAINTLYVATTRAEQQLHIIGEHYTGKSKEISNINRLLNTFIKDNELTTNDISINVEDEVLGVQQVIIKDGENHYSKPKSNSLSNTVQFQSQQLGKVIDSIHLERESSSKRAPLVSEFTKAKKRGVLLHYIFERIVYNDEVDGVINEQILSGTITPEQKDELKAEIERVLSLPQISKYYQRSGSLKVLNERSLLNKSILRPDRVIIENDQLTIIDYKTGNFNRSHELQIQEYMQTFKKIGYKSIQGFLIYTETPEAVKVNLN